MHLTSNVAPSSKTAHNRYVVSVASSEDRQAIYGSRHDVYATELGQHPQNIALRLADDLDARNIYLVVRVNAALAGFISVTAPGEGPFSIEKYIRRESLPFACDDGVYEVRLLTVLKPYRGGESAALLMYAAFRWIQAHGGTRIVAIGRQEVMDMYLRGGLQLLGMTVRSGAVTYHAMHTTLQHLEQHLQSFRELRERLERCTQWDLPFPFHKPAPCFHGGAFFDAIGPGFDHLERSTEIINADVLDAWFPPSPKVTAALQEYLPWLLRTSPPNDCGGMAQAIALARGVRPQHILPGAGSSDLIFRAFCAWLTRRSRALILDPTYGEYAHVLEKVIGCTVDRLVLRSSEGYRVDLDRLEAALSRDYDLIVLVNPNSPTGQHIPCAVLRSVLGKAHGGTRIWVDETYVEYAGEGQSLETFAAGSENVIVCKSMSKVYALSGARAAYLCAGQHQLEQLRGITPPWAVSLPAQVAAVKALEDPSYYAKRYRETANARETLAQALEALGWGVMPGIANFLLCQLPSTAPTAEALVLACRDHGLFIRNAAAMGSSLGDRCVRIAVKDPKTNLRICEILKGFSSPSRRLNWHSCRAGGARREIE